jgi:uncharacterized protein
MQAPSNYPGSLTDLSADESWALLRTRPFGRVAWSGTDGIRVVPVNYVVEHGTIVLRTTPYSDLARHAGDLEVGFEVDHIDDITRTGWSVLARGRCHRVEFASVGTPEVWVDGMRMLTIRIEVRSLSGRRIRPFFEPA